jgi:hypothetical protein
MSKIRLTLDNKFIDKKCDFLCNYYMKKSYFGLISYYFCYLFKKTINNTNRCFNCLKCDNGYIDVYVLDDYGMKYCSARCPFLLYNWDSKCILFNSKLDNYTINGNENNVYIRRCTACIRNKYDKVDE